MSLRKLLCALIILSGPYATADWVNSYIGSPTSNQTVASNSLHVIASAKGGAPIGGWMIYMDSDSQPYYRSSGSVGASLDMMMDISRLPVGSHQMIVKAWDNYGTEGDSWTWFTHAASSPAPGPSGFLGSSNIPLPPGNAVYTSNVDNISNWKAATGAASQCADGVPSSTCHPVNANYNSVVQHSRDPASLGGSDNYTGTFQLYNSPAYATAIWGHDLLTNINAHNFIWDMWIYVDSTNYGASEIDFFQSGYNGQRLMIGSQCNRAVDTWDLWNEVAQTWVHSGVSCSGALSAGRWHRLTYYLGTNPSANTYTYHAIRVDGVDHVIDKQFYGKYAGWPQGLIGVQIQLDANQTGAGVNESFESMQVISW